MNTKMRSEFWKCGRCGDCYSTERAVCYCGMGCAAHSETRIATNKEVLVAWLEADDERRREIEIASRPTKAGLYKLWNWDGDTLEYRQVAVNCHPNETWKNWKWEDGFWEPLT